MRSSIIMELNLKMAQINFMIVLVSFMISSSFLWFDNLISGQPVDYPTKGNLSESESSIPDIFDRVKTSVVQISPPFNLTNSSLLGSGFVFDKYGHIITNSHVIENASTVTVTFIDEKQYDAVVIGKDIVNDIAVLKLPGDITEPVVPLEFGNSSAARIGERIFTVGNPYGFANTLTGGFISQVGRLILESGSIAPFPHSDMIQTDALINPGNSGGPLVNLQGLVIGMTTANIDSPHGGATGLGFAIPSKTLLREVPILIENGTYSHPWLGISAHNLNSEINKKIGLLSNFKGVLVDSVVKDGPAYKAGIQGSDILAHGDIITALDGNPINNIRDLSSFIENNKRAGQEIVISVYRNNQAMALIGTLGDRPLSVYTSPYITSQTPIF